jgi:hypothetical protein
MISVEKPGSPSEILEHAGVKGMKWGVQKARTTGSAVGAGVAKKAAGVRAARAARPARKGIALGRASREFRATHPTAKTQARAIRTARKDVNARLKTIRKTKDTVEQARLLRDHRNHPGTAILRTTRGEKAVGILLGGFVPGAAPAMAGFGLGQTGTRRFDERKQRRGGFQKEGGEAWRDLVRR